MADKYGLVLAGGGAKGAYQIGALKAIYELGLFDKINMVSGTSIGAINLALFQNGDIAGAEKIWAGVNADDFIELDDNGFDVDNYDDGIFSREGLIRILKENVDFSKLTNSERPLFVTVCRRISEHISAPFYIRLNYKDENTIIKYLMASSAIPIVYDAVEVEGNMYFDGGLCDNTPIKPLVDEGATDIIVISNDNEYTVPDFPGINIYPIIPSHSLVVDSILGTEDLSRSGAAYRLELGYRDAQALLPRLLNHETIPDLSGNHMLADQALRINKASSRVSQSMSDLENMLGKYGINL